MVVEVNGKSWSYQYLGSLPESVSEAAQMYPRTGMRSDRIIFRAHNSLGVT